MLSSSRRVENRQFKLKETDYITEMNSRELATKLPTFANRWALKFREYEKGDRGAKGGVGGDSFTVIN